MITNVNAQLITQKREEAPKKLFLHVISTFNQPMVQDSFTIEPLNSKGELIVKLYLLKDHEGFLVKADYPVVHVVPLTFLMENPLFNSANIQIIILNREDGFEFSKLAGGGIKSTSDDIADNDVRPIRILPRNGKDQKVAKK